MTAKDESQTAAPGIDLAKVAEWVAEQRSAAGDGADPYDRYFVRLMFQEAVNGDESFGKAAITHLASQVVSGRLDEYGAAALGLILQRLLDSPSSIKAICGVPNRTGQRRRGYDGLMLAIDTSNYLRDHGGSLEQAAKALGRKHSLSPRAIKGHWWDRKKQLLGALRAHAATLHPSASDAELDAVARVVLCGDKSASPEDLAIFDKLAIASDEAS